MNVMDQHKKARLAELADKLDTGGLTTSEQFELARLIRQFMEDYDDKMLEVRHLLRNPEGSGWGYVH